MNRRRIGLIVGAMVMALLATGLWRAFSARQAQQAAVAALGATKQETGIELRAQDWVQARELKLSQGVPVSGSLRAGQSALVKARVAGELQDLLVREGDAVRAGQVLARIEPTEVKARLRQAEDQAAAARAQLEAAQRQWDNNKALVDQGFISRTALDLSLSNFNSAKASHQAALAAVDLARKSVDDAVLRAPIAGWVSARLAQNGERVGIDARVLEIVDIGQLELEAQLAPADAARLQIGQPARLSVEGMREALAARVLRISPSAQTGSRAVTVYLGLPGRPGLRQGLFATGQVEVGSAEGVGLPLSAIRTDKPLPYVQVLEQGRIAHRSVSVRSRGEHASEAYALVEGVAAGTAVVRGEVGILRAGTPARDAASAAR